LSWQKRTPTSKPERATCAWQRQVQEQALGDRKSNSDSTKRVKGHSWRCLGYWNSFVCLSPLCGYWKEARNCQSYWSWNRRETYRLQTDRTKDLRTVLLHPGFVTDRPHVSVLVAFLPTVVLSGNLRRSLGRRSWVTLCQLEQRVPV
jgi:hypothetical protein